MKIAISGEALGSEKTLDEILKIIKHVNVNAIEIWPENIPLLEGKELLHKRLYANRDVKKAKAILEENRVEVASVCFGAGFDRELAADEELFAQELERAVTVAEELGAKIVNHYCYYVSMQGFVDTEKLKRYYAKAIEKAESCGITLVLENEAHDVTKTPEQMKTILRAMNSESFQTNFDAVNYYQAGVEAFPYAYEVLKKEIAHVHIKNGCIYHKEYGHLEESKGQTMTGKEEGNVIYYPYAADGAVNVYGIVKRLVQDGFCGYCVLEPHTTVELCLKYYEEEAAYLYETGFFES